MAYAIRTLFVLLVVLGFCVGRCSVSIPGTKTEPCPHAVEKLVAPNGKEIRMEGCITPDGTEVKMFLDGELAITEFHHNDGSVTTKKDDEIIKKFIKPPPTKT